MTWHLPQPILAAPTADAALPPGWAAEPKWDGYRAHLARYADAASCCTPAAAPT
ncbi:hypothetical protein OHU34_01110 [Streptomyces sp. NBC_00080]|uniref:hypothetical protein n=1 Tax=unclassified Streptomyces TaxID=2593676 RepID=UPI001170EB94|nr:hypothetical protein [Streptomyces sp. SLBN-115]TQJ36856.1 hypothetical protein FBY34_8809 [Streptomyces sp. SLBN-115]